MGTEVAITRAPVLGEPVAIELMNTVWADGGGVHDALSTGAEVAAWLRAVEHRLTSDGANVPTRGMAWPLGPDSYVPGPVIEQLRLLRDALRRLAAEVTDDLRPGALTSIVNRRDASSILNEASALAPTWTQLSWPDDGSPRRSTCGTRTPGELAISLLAQHGIDLFAGSMRRELRACRAPGCVLYFVKNHPRREWCTSACGNRARVARHYERHRAERRSDHRRRT
jgi:predicted RNA-binding Zn ribbon-like protein